MRNLNLQFTSHVWRNLRTRIVGRSNLVYLALFVSGTSLPLLWFLHRWNVKNSNQQLNTETSSLSQSNNSLCQLCRSVSLTEMCGPNCDRMQLHQPSYLALKKSSSGGCQLCGYIWTAMERSVTSEPLSGEVSEGRLAMSHVSDQYPGRQISLIAWGNADGWLDRILVTTTGDIPDLDSDEEGAGSTTDPTMHPDHQVALSGVLYLFTYPDDPAAWHGKIRGRPLPKTAGDSDEDFELAKLWLNDCLCNHPSCRKATPREIRLPTRVLDIGPADGSEEPYLLETHGMHGYYITLSHCWGGQVPLTTTYSTISERKRTIPLASLPKTFHDAVLISRKLGVRYLWIDSLCIVQDSTLDWEKESAMMGDVYGQSYLTIAARGAANADIGCFIMRKELLSCRLEYHSSDGSIKGRMYVRDPDFQAELTGQFPLDRRGWVLQERILSPRCLYYGSQQLYWECTSTTIRQDGMSRDVHVDGHRGYNGFREDWDPDATSRPRFKNDKDKQRSDSNGMPVELLERMCQWYMIIEEYTNRKLTFASDTLPAIAGIAKKFHQKTGYSYVAGLWKEDLLAGLLWYRVGASLASTSLKLPTWSWARFSGKVKFWNSNVGNMISLDTSCELIDVSYRTTNSLLNYGEITNARIKIKGRVVPVVFKETGEDFSDTVFYTEEALYTKGGARVGRPIFDIPDFQKLGFTYFCLLVDQGYGSSAGLVLERVEGQAREYKRIGYVAIENHLHGEEPRGRTIFSNISPQILTMI